MPLLTTKYVCTLATYFSPPPSRRVMAGVHCPLIRIVPLSSFWVMDFKKMILVPSSEFGHPEGFQNQPVSMCGFFTDAKRCSLLWRHVSSSSSLLLSIVCWSSVRIIIFSVKHRSQAFPPLANGWPRALMDHLTSNGIFWSLSFQTYEERVVCLAGLFLSEDLWPEYLLLKFLVEP